LDQRSTLKNFFEPRPCLTLGVGGEAAIRDMGLIMKTALRVGNMVGNRKLKNGKRLDI